MAFGAIPSSPDPLMAIVAEQRKTNALLERIAVALEALTAPKIEVRNRAHPDDNLTIPIVTDGR